MAQLMTLDKLVNSKDDGLPLVVEYLKSQVHEFIPVATKKDGERELVALQVTTRSPMGAIAYSQAAIMLQHGFVRILGAGRHPRIQRSIVSFSAGKFAQVEVGSSSQKGGQKGAIVRPGALAIADDVLGGIFALNGGALSNVAIGHIAYFCPSMLVWDDLGFGYSAFLEVMGQKENFESFYKDVLWDSWKEDLASVHGDSALHVFPPLSTVAESRSRKVVPVEENYRFLQDLASTVGGKVGSSAAVEVPGPSKLD